MFFSLQHELARRKKELQFLTQEKRTLEHQVRQQQEQKRSEVKSSNPWYISRLTNETPGISQQQPAASSSTRRFLYKSNENKRRTPSCGNQPSIHMGRSEPSRKRAAVANEATRSERGGSFDFDVDVSFLFL